MDNTSIHPASNHQVQHIDLHLWRGAPINLDESRPIQILVNQGYVIGYSPDRMQPLWSAYRVAHADQDVDFDRPHVYYEDMRLEEEVRIGPDTFGKIGDIQLHVGHMTPNEVINRQYGRLAQMETFFMSNMSPQYGTLNTGVWLKLENAIRAIEDTDQKDHVWVIVGPIFDEDPNYVSRPGNKLIPVPKSYYCITVDPHTYPYKYPSNATINCYIIPQEAPKSANPLDFPATLEEVEEATKLEFFPSWGRELPTEVLAQRSLPVKSRLQESLEKIRAAEEAKSQQLQTLAEKQEHTIQDMIDNLEKESKLIHKGRLPLSEEELDRLNMIQHSISYLLKAQQITASEGNGKTTPKKDKAKPLANIITYKIVDDFDDKLKKSARIACNFWNRFVEPKFSVVIRLDLFSRKDGTIAMAYKPHDKDGVRYGRVSFNTKFLSTFTDKEIAGTIIHELGHSLGIGWTEWKELFDNRTGKFKSKYVKKLNTLSLMEVELDGGDGTAEAHWDELRFQNALMTGYKDKNEIVLPVTIEVMELLGHKVLEVLESPTGLSDLMNEVEGVVFSKQNEIRKLDLDYFVETEVFETIGG